jgi:uncharacterized membrane protein YphA (DoxX/SURF4 family)
MKRLHIFLIYFIAVVWLANGLFCKVLNLVSRHEQIIARILGNSQASLLRMVIGILEILMSVWIITGIKARFNAVVQMSIVALMNILEFILAPDLLLWGKWNAFYAFLFIMVIYYNEFVLNKNANQLI